MKLTVYAPGRVNIIGEHTDHQDGLVLPVCIQMGITLTGKTTETGIVNIASSNFSGTDSFSYDNITKTGKWSDYIRGSISKFIDYTGVSPSIDIKISSTLPVASGLSSSAAIEVATITLLNELYSTNLPREKIVQLAWEAETEFVGVKCGIMDQMIIGMSQSPCPLIINCSSMKTREMGIHPDIRFLLVQTLKTRKLSTSKYNTRIEELEMAKVEVNNLGYNIDSISELDIIQLDEIRNQWSSSGIILNRLTHVIEENHRVQQYYDYFNQNNYQKAGNLMFDSHESLKTNFKASWEEANEVVESCKTILEIDGARMVGAGWGGNVLIQVKAESLEKVSKELVKQITWLTDSMIIPLAMDYGVRIL